jgi:hypothetical protein
LEVLAERRWVAVTWSTLSDVFEDTYLDYALKLDAAPRLYVEAKGLNENLDDKKFIAQTVNYANYDRVVWCVLTNGARVRVHKTNEPVSIAMTAGSAVPHAETLRSDPTCRARKSCCTASRPVAKSQ